MKFDKKPLRPPAGMTFEQMLSLPVSQGKWRESNYYMCARCIQNAFHHPYTNKIWGCRECGTTTTELASEFMPNHGDPIDDSCSLTKKEQAAVAKAVARDGGPFLTRLPKDESAGRLSEFKVTLQRMPPGERAVDPNDRKNLGMRTKLGGEPDWIQLGDGTPKCKDCGERMTFVAQIDSIEHITQRNPFAFDRRDRDPSIKPWMFCDVGMIYVFFCFDCLKSQSVVQYY